MNSNMIYFDNAATGFPKPNLVKRAVFEAFDKYGGNPGRSGHRMSSDASKAVYECREEICRLIDFDSPESVVFTLNATHALNISIKGIAEKGSHILISNLEHNSVFRPVYALCSDPLNQMTFSVFDASCRDDDIVFKRFVSALRPETKLVVVTHVSNICGKILPVRRIADYCRNNNIKIIVDSSQAMGHINFRFDDLKADVLCAAGHKGLYGPSGTGFAVFAKSVEPKPFIEGGNGVTSLLPVMGNVLPEMLEAGTLNTVGICGLREGIRYIRMKGIEEITSKCESIDKFITENLYDIGAEIYSDFPNKTPITLFNLPGISAEKVTELLDDKGICTRGGIHCAPLAHKALFTGSHGAVRASYGYYNTMNEAEKFISVIQSIIRNR